VLRPATRPLKGTAFAWVRPSTRTFRLSPRATVLVGPNGQGKTSTMPILSHVLLDARKSGELAVIDANEALASPLRRAERVVCGTALPAWGL
jgi:ABC-type uncharacterized transport system ATPase subunit